MESPFYSLGQGRPGKAKELPFKGCYCGCGIILESRQLFKAHFFEVHRQTFISGSSHYVSLFSEIVLPVRCWDISMMKQITIETKYEEKDVKAPIKNEVILTNDSSESYKSGPRIGKSVDKKQKEREINQNGERRRRRKNERGGNPLQTEMSLKNIEWNGFVLVPNKMNLVRGFMCGKCGSMHDTAERFIFHCFDVCQQLEHPKSSHFVVGSEDVQQSQLQIVKVPASQPARKRKVKPMQGGQPGPEKKKVQRVAVCREPFRALIPNEIAEEKKGIYDFFKEQRQTETFICGCGQTVRPSQRPYLHLLKHCEIVPENSSHIFIQKNVKRHYNMLAIAGEDDGRLWWCPCRPGVSMTKSVFVNHILYIHKGISPQYKVEHFRTSDV